MQSLSALPAVLASPPLLAALRPLRDFLPACSAGARADLALCRATLAAVPHLQWRQVPCQLCLSRRLGWTTWHDRHSYHATIRCSLNHRSCSVLRTYQCNCCLDAE